MKLWMYRLDCHNTRMTGQSVGLIQAETEKEARIALAEDMGDNACIANIWEPTISDKRTEECYIPFKVHF